MSSPDRPQFVARPSGVKEIDPSPEIKDPVKFMIFIDAENLWNTVRRLTDIGQNFSLDELFSLISNNGAYTTRALYYTRDAETIPDGQLKFLLDRGVKIIAIPGKIIHGEIKAGPVDLDIATDMTGMADLYEEAVLVGGDGDFGYPVEKLIREKGKKVTVISGWKDVGRELPAAGARVIFLEDLIPMLTYRKKPKPKDPIPQLRVV